MAKRKKSFKKQYRDLEMKIFNSLRELISKGTQTSRHLNEKVISVNIANYQELAIVNDKLTLLDHKGYHFSIFACSLDDLIDIIE